MAVIGRPVDMSRHAIDEAAAKMAGKDRPQADSTVEELMQKYRIHRVPPLNELVREEIIEIVYRGFIEKHKIPMAIFWPTGDPNERSSWEPLQGINNEQLHGTFCKACRNYRTPVGLCPLLDSCLVSDVDHAWEVAKGGRLIQYMCYNGMLDLALPVVLEDRTTAVLFTGQLRPREGLLWDTTEMGGVDVKGTGVDLWAECRRRIADRQKVVGSYENLEYLAQTHTVVGPEELSKYRKDLEDARDILLELASARMHLDRQRITGHMRGKLFEAPLQRRTFWQFLGNWLNGIRGVLVPDHWYVLVLTHDLNDKKINVNVSLGLLDLREGRYAIADQSLLEQMTRLPDSAPRVSRFRVQRLLDGYNLPAVPANVIPLGKYGFVIFGSLNKSDDFELWEFEKVSAAQFCQDIGLLIEDMEALNAKDDFLTYFSHELRSPIHSAGITAERLRKGHFEVGSASFDLACRRLQAQLNRLLRLIEGLWHIQKILAGQATYVPRRVILYDFLATRATQAQDMSDREDLKIIVDRSTFTGLKAVELDEQAFELVVFNLLDNAVKYSSAGKEIRVFARKDGPDILLTFTNVGIGIPNAWEEKIFERFVRTREAICLAPHSAGIGLFLVRHIVEGHAGRVTAKSEPFSSRDHLVTFEIRLPARQ